MVELPAIVSFSGPHRFLSNFFPWDRVGPKREWVRVHPWDGIEWEGIHYPSTEHAYQAAKTLDMDVRRKIAALENSYLAKKAGAKLRLREDWSDPLKLTIMEELERIKYVPGKELAKMLLDTYPATLIEGNWWNDTFWGTCKGHGLNHLGRILMRVREELR